MSLSDYQESAASTAILSGNTVADLSHFAFGLNAEAGEVSSIFQKFYRGDPRYFVMDTGDLTEEAKGMLFYELGDTLWHVAVLADVMGWSLDQIAEANTEKLRRRKERGVIQGDGDNR